MALRIPTPPNFAFEPTVVSHGWYLLAPFQWDRASRTLHRVEEIGGRALELRIRWQRGHLIVESPDDLQLAKTALQQRLTRMFQLQVDTTEFLRLCGDSPAHNFVVNTRFGRMLCGSTLFEDAIKIITTTNTTWRQTMRMVELLTGRLGKRTPSGRRAFPNPRQVARRSVEELKEECRLGYRARSVHALAKGIVTGSIDLARVQDPQQSTQELFQSYQSLPGIGPYGAAHLLAMDGRHDFIAVDTEFRRFVREQHFKGRNVSDRTMVKRYARWGRWQYLAYWAELWGSVSPRLEAFEKGLE